MSIIDHKKKSKRVPWHVTLFAGAVWFALCLSPVLAVVFAAAGVLYLAWPKLRRRTERDAQGPGDAEQL